MTTSVTGPYWMQGTTVHPCGATTSPATHQRCVRIAEAPVGVGAVTVAGDGILELGYGLSQGWTSKYHEIAGIRDDDAQLSSLHEQIPTSLIVSADSSPCL
jgi:hypothetical protein